MSKNNQKLPTILVINNKDLKIISSSSILGIYEYLNKLKILEVIDKKEKTLIKKGK